VFPPRRLYDVPLPDNRILHLGGRPFVMGILNLTPDSFGESSHLVAGGSIDVPKENPGKADRRNKRERKK